jgi:hypothetical protein
MNGAKEKTACVCFRWSYGLIGSAIIPELINAGHQVLD